MKTNRILSTALIFVFIMPLICNGMELSPVTVKSSIIQDYQELSPGTVSVIRPEERKGEFKTLPDLLRQSAGVHITEIQGHGGYTVASIRGSTSSQVAIYLDGVLLNSAGEPTVDLSVIPIDNVEQIEIYRGHIPARFGVSGMGAVINIVTYDASISTNSFMAGMGSLGLKKWSSRNSFPTGKGKSLLTTELEGYTGDFSFHNTRGTSNSEDDYQATRRFNQYSFQNIMYKWEDAYWKVKANYYHKNRDIPYSARLNWDTIDNPEIYGRRRQDIQKKEISLGRSFEMNGFEGSLYLLYLKESKDFSDPTGVKRGNMPSWSVFDSSRMEGGWELSKWVGENHQIGLYGSWSFENYDVDGNGAYSIYTLKRYNRHNFNITLEDSFFPLKNSDLHIVPMVRYNSAGDHSGWSWSTAVAYPISKGWTLKSSVGHYFRSPGFYEILGDGVYIVPNESIKPEKGDHWDIGLRWDGTIDSVKACLGATYFSTKTKDLIVFVDRGPFQGKYENIDDAKVEGVEVEISAEWASSSISIGYTYMNSTNLAVDDQYRGNPLPNRPKNAWHFRVQQGLGDRLSGFADYSYISENYLDELGEVVWSDYGRLDLGVKWQMKENLLLSLGVNDVFDNTSNIHTYGASLPGVSLTPDYPLEGRTTYLSLIWDI